MPDVSFIVLYRFIPFEMAFTVSSLLRLDKIVPNTRSK